uniref:Variant surface glycoprotein 808 n=1 Tax=Trypanosoma brucei TaxID=5691 RepID=M4T0S0_9TRYP|nr:variant surface glycoprotein 808 [Trypanosoma brucei]
MQHAVVGKAVLAVLLYTAQKFVLVEGSSANGGNAPAFASLCGIYNLKTATKAPSWDRTFQDETVAIEAILNANFSTAMDSYLKDKDQGFNNIPEGTERQKSITKWQEDVQRRQNLKPDPEKELTYGRSPDTPYRAIANIQISRLHEQAADIAKTYKKLKDAVSAAHGNAIKEITEAIYGTGQKAFKPTGFTDPKQDMCGGQGGNANVGKCLINDMICLCTAHSGGSEKVCGQQDFTDVPTSPAGAQSTAARQLEAACAQAKTEQPLTSALINSRISNFLTNLGALPGSETHASVRFVLGAATSSGCTGSSQKECVNYNVQLKSSGTGIAWLNKLMQASKDLHTAEQQAAEAVALELELQRLASSAEALRLSANTGLKLPSTLTLPTNSNPGSSPVEPKKAEECKMHKPKKTCEEKGCKWNGTGDTEGACEAKSGSENTAVGRGDGAAGANTETKKCSEKTKQEECKDGCKWEENKCRDSSILVNKKFALSTISAAFLALLFKRKISPSIFKKFLLLEKLSDIF